MFTGKQGITTAFELSDLSSVLNPTPDEAKAKKNRIAMDRHGRYHWRNEFGDTGCADTFNEARVGVLERDITRQVHGFLNYAAIQFRQEAIQEGMIAIWTFLEAQLQDEREKAHCENRLPNEILPHTDSYLFQRAMAYARNHHTKEYRHIKVVDSMQALAEDQGDNWLHDTSQHIGCSINGEREVEQTESTAMLQHIRQSASSVALLLLNALMLGQSASAFAVQQGISRKDVQAARLELQQLASDAH